MQPKKIINLNKMNDLRSSESKIFKVTEVLSHHEAFISEFNSLDSCNFTFFNHFN